MTHRQNILNNRIRAVLSMNGIKGQRQTENLINWINTLIDQEYKDGYDIGFNEGYNCALRGDAEPDPAPRPHSEDNSSEAWPPDRGLGCNW